MADLNRVLVELDKIGVLAEPKYLNDRRRVPEVIKKDFGVFQVNDVLDSRNEHHHSDFGFDNSIENIYGRIFYDYDAVEWGDLIRRIGGLPGKWGDEREEGVDALAWYLSFHYDQDDWGIYIPLSGLLKFAGKISPSMPPGGWADAIELAARGLMAHELFHYAVDYGSAQLEILERVPVYCQGRRMNRGAFGYVEVEEAIANGFTCKLFKSSSYRGLVPNCEREFWNFMRRQPPGYRDGERYSKRQDIILGVKQLLLSWLHSAGGNSHFSPEIVDFFMLLPFSALSESQRGYSRGFAIDGSQCPIYVIDDLATFSPSAGGVGFISTVPNIVETEAFLKDLRDLKIENIWFGQTKNDLALNPIPSRCHFRPWPYGDTKTEQGFYVNVGRGNTKFRGHLRRPKGQPGMPWTAYEAVDSERSAHHKKGGRRGRQ